MPSISDWWVNTRDQITGSLADQASGALTPAPPGSPMTQKSPTTSPQGVSGAGSLSPIVIVGLLVAVWFLVK